MPLVFWLLSSLWVSPQESASVPPERETAAVAKQLDSPQAADQPPGPPASAAELARRIKPALVAITAEGRGARGDAIGTGFLVAAPREEQPPTPAPQADAEEALVVTNLHVIGEGRRFALEHSSGAKLEVLGVQAFDRLHDLAVLRVRANPQATRLPLAAAAPEQGAEVVAMGNPLGFRYSVVQGVVSGRRDIENRSMLQLALPVEPGNSGGPVVDRQGRVVGVITMKSADSNNLGFAIEADALRRLLQRPNPMTLDRWRALADLDAERWSTVFGGNWRDANGRILVSEPGEGFGGRTLCLWKGAVDEAPLEIGVWVKLDDETGAAGLAFHSDGRHQHYGFYPSDGALRLTRFQGPTVYNWTILHNEPHPAYRQGEWNHLKVRLTAEQLECFVNDQLVTVSRDSAFRTGAIGLVKFRDTAAEFRGFAFGREVPRSGLDDAARSRIDAWIEQLPDFSRLGQADLQLAAEATPRDAVARLRERADELRRRADQLQRMARQVHVDAVCEQLRSWSAEQAGDLLQAALIMAKLDYPELDVEAYRRSVARMAADVRGRAPQEADPPTLLEHLDEYLFRESGFHGSRHDYYNAANSYMNLVIEDREGLPITLSVLYMSLAAELGVPLEGVGLPGHFLVRYPGGDGEEFWIDVFDGGKRLARGDLGPLVREHAGVPLAPEHLRAVEPRAILIRMLRNLLGLAETSRDRDKMLGYLDALLTLDPNSHQDRGVRAMVRFEAGRHQAAIDDLDVLLDAEPEGIDLERVRELRDMFQRRRE